LKRKYLNRIEVWLNSDSDDLSGGLLTEPSKVNDSWCNVKTVNRSNLTAYGLDIAVQAIRIRTRHRNDLDYFQEGLFFKYKQKDWMVNSIHDVDLDGEELDIIATAIQ